ncbi:MAG: trehalose-6-phosphate synthase, partial [Terriglobales bacterium]
VLSVDRADYTKAVIERLNIVDRFFERRPEMVGNLSFLQICGRSRAGLPAFDSYWNDCRSLYEQINNRWRKDSWQPVQWMEQPLNASELSVLYRRASAMLVNPVRDGLNLTAKEYVACQDKKPGVLLLSPGAGVWHEIGKYALPADPHQPEQVVDSLAKALHMSEFESKAINVLARIKLEKFCLDTWWNYFERVSMKSRPAMPAAASRDELDIKTA